MTEGDAGFLSRWARRKALAKSGAAVADPARPTEVSHLPDAGRAAAPAVAPAAPAASAARADAAPGALRPEAPPLPTMDDVAALTPASDFSRFVATGVDRGVSNAAMRKLFADPRFNVMDGLDTYIDDYGKADPIPESMLRQMNQSKLLRLFADDERSATAAPAATACTDGEGGDPVAESGRVRACESLDDGSIAVAAAPPATDPTPAAPLVPARAPDDDPDLRLQQDDAAGCAGAAPGARG